MKIGIITFWNSNDNYGQLLQLYALQKHLQLKGQEPFLIKYIYTNDNNELKRTGLEKIKRFFDLKKVMNYIVYRYNQHKRNTIVSIDRGFELFRNEYISSTKEYYSLKQLRDNPPEADIYIVGSDQVWNFYSEDIRIIRNKVHAFFLDFGPESVHRVSYAASWGRTNMSKEEICEITPLIRRFEFVSVREKTGLKLCKDCGYSFPQWRCDPTMLLEPDIYRKLYNEKEIRIPEEKYVLFYYLDNGGDFEKESVFRWAKKMNLSVIYVTGNKCQDKYYKKYPSVHEWLGLIDNAQSVITNSFHCCVFSIIFQKKFACIKLTGKNKEMNTRIDSLFEMCNIFPRYIIDGSFEVIEREPQEPQISVELRNLDFLRI